MAFACRARDLEAASSISTYTTKVGFGANTLTNIPSFQHEQDLNPGGSRMEIYETISHVSTNQVWLHINSASSRVYFRPIALFSFVGSAGAGQLARSYLCLESLSPSPLRSPTSHPQTLPPFLAPRQPPFLLPYSPGMHAIALSLILRSRDRIPKSPPTTHQHGGALLIALRYV